MNQAPT